MTKTDRRVITAINQLDRIAAFYYEDRGEESPSKTFAHRITEIKKSVDSDRGERSRLGYRQLVSSLDRLVASGELHETRVDGMAGGFAMWSRS
jgi:hypothetical protein